MRVDGGALRSEDVPCRGTPLLPLCTAAPGACIGFIKSLGCRGLGFRLYGLRFRVLRFRVQGFGFRVEGLGSGGLGCWGRV